MTENSNSANVKVVIRVRPLTTSYHAINSLQESKFTSISQALASAAISKEIPSETHHQESVNMMAQRRCIKEVSQKKQLTLDSLPETFTFDYIASEETAQQEIFEEVGRSIIEQCLHGYNGSIFAYGQTGSGKTFTIQGGKQEEMRGLLPRCFEYLFAQITKIKQKHKFKRNSTTNVESSASAGKSLYNQAMFQDERVVEIDFEVKCAYVEIYNEMIFDLLDSLGRSKLQIREDKGLTFLESCTEIHVASLKEVMEVIKKGQENRHVAATNMNMESSRSHAVFTAYIRTQTLHNDGQKVMRSSRFHIVDLAGSERVKDTQADGQRLKELCNINKSLSNLGKVIYELAENCKTKQRTAGYINFRASKLTHLLKDSLGGNAKTVMICTLNPHFSAIKETLSTLKFAQRAKMIRNQAIVNEENNDSEFWKRKFNQLQLQIMQQQAAGSNQMQVDFSGRPSESIEKLTNMLVAKSSQLQDSHQSVKLLTQNLKEQTTLVNELRANFNRASQDMSSYKKSLTFRLNLAQARIDKLMESQPAEIQQLVKANQEEVQHLKSQLENNPLLAERHAKVAELEAVLTQNNLASSFDKISQLLVQVLVSEESQRLDLTFIENELKSEPGQQTKSFVSDRFSQERMSLEGEVEYLRKQVMSLESKNRKYLEVIGGTAFSDPQLAQRVTSTEVRETKRLTQSRQQAYQNSSINLDDLTDILEQAEHQLQQKEQEITIMKSELEQVRQQLSDVQASNSQTDQILHAASQAKKQQAMKIEQLVQQIEELRYENQQLALNSLRLEEMETNYNHVKCKLLKSQEEVESLQQTNDYFQKQTIPELEKCNQLVQKRLNDLERTKDELTERLAIQAQQFNGKATQEMSQMQVKYESILVKIKSYEDTERTLMTKLEIYLKEISGLNEELRWYKQFKTTADQEHASFKEKNSELNSQVESMERALAEMLHVQQNLESQNKDIFESKVVLEKELKKVQVELRESRSQNKKLEGQMQAEHDKQKQMWQIRQDQERKYNQQVESLIEFRQKAQQYIGELTDQSQLISELQKSLTVRDQQMQLMAQALKEQKAKSSHAVATKQVHDKISALTQENQQLAMRAKFDLQQINDCECQIQMLADQNNALIKERQQQLDDNTKLLTTKNPQAKQLYLDKQRQEMNQVKQDNMKLQEELQKTKRQAEKQKQNIDQNMKSIATFGSNLGKIFNLTDIYQKQLYSEIPQQTSLDDYLVNLIKKAQEFIKGNDSFGAGQVPTETQEAEESDSFNFFENKQQQQQLKQKEERGLSEKENIQGKKFGGNKINLNGARILKQ